LRVRVVPYKMASTSAKLFAEALTEALGYKVWRGPYRIGKRNIFWGNPNGANASKLDSFRVLAAAGCSIPDFTTDPEEAKQWVNTGSKVVCRKLLKASEGRGIVLATTLESLVQAPLYVKYVPKKKEFRVHVLGGEVILVQEKRKRRGSKADYQVRNHGDWVFCVNDIVEPEGLRKVGLDAVLAVCPATLSGAADIVWNEKKNKCYVLEVNSAPGLCPSSAKVYADFVKGKVDATNSV
jgi:glutathione synthase/RimK-type ligase-like ATP-grasp enzyme